MQAENCILLRNSADFRYLFWKWLCAGALFWFAFAAEAAAPALELARPLPVVTPDGAVQIPAGQPVDLIRGTNGNGEVMIRFVLPNGRLRMALVPATEVRPRTAHPTPVPTAAATPVPEASVAATPAQEFGTTATPPRLAVPSAVAPPAAVAAPSTGSNGAPDFGPNVLLCDPSMTDLQSRVDAIADQQKTSQFGNGRYALLFKPGE